jgi:hypothetical protein
MQLLLPIKVRSQSSYCEHIYEVASSASSADRSCRHACTSKAVHLPSAWISRNTITPPITRKLCVYASRTRRTSRTCRLSYLILLMSSVRPCSKPSACTTATQPNVGCRVIFETAPLHMCTLPRRSLNAVRTERYIY